MMTASASLLLIMYVYTFGRAANHQSNTEMENYKKKKAFE